MSFKYTVQPPDGGIFNSDAFASQVGRRTTVRNGAQSHEAIVLDVKVADDGRSAEVTVDADLSVILPQAAQAIRPTDFSFADESRRG
jgi:hypothetical protein